jgi:porphobilinogen synthase
MGRIAAAPPGLSPDLKERPRRLRRTAALRALVRETRMAPSQLVLPMFVTSGRDRADAIPSLPGHARLSADRAVALARELSTLGVGGVILFGIPDAKDDDGRAAADSNGPVAVTLRAMRDAGLPLVLMADVCLCEYTTHGHCGVIVSGDVDNDATLPIIAEAAVTYAEAGADIVGPSGMMDGQVAAIRAALDESGRQQTAILAYSSKAASAFYGPFREAAGSAPAFGDRRGYQMDFANAREALREMELDVREGADMLMVKPAVTSLDLLARARRRFNVPLAAYHVSGEVAMIEAAAANGWVDRRDAVMESLTAIVRAGADVVLTYLAADAARWLQER